MVLDRGIITSCDLPVNPHYHIKARKIWVLAPGEWAIASAVLYIGRVPVMYLPFFFRPGDEFFFHPAIGFPRPGRQFPADHDLPDRPEDPHSQRAVRAGGHRGAGPAVPPGNPRACSCASRKASRSRSRDNRFLKVFLDYYTRLGVFAGISGDFPPRVSFRSGLGLSRNIYLTSKGYSPWNLDAFRPSYDSVWNKAWFLGMEIPFRYGLDGKWNLSGARSKFSGKFEYYSDPFFARDFYNRSEETALTRLLGMEATQTLIQTEGEKRALSWELNTQAEFQTGGLGPT